MNLPIYLINWYEKKRVPNKYDKVQEKKHKNSAKRNFSGGGFFSASINFMELVFRIVLKWILLWRKALISFYFNNGFCKNISKVFSNLPMRFLNLYIY